MKNKLFKSIGRSLTICVLFSAGLMFTLDSFAQDQAAQAQPAAQGTPTPPAAQPDGKAAAKPTTKKEATSKKKLKKHQKVKYRDLNVVLGIRKEVYFNFPLGNIRPPTDLSIFRFEKNTKEQNPKQDRDRIVITGLKTGMTDLWVYDNQDVLRFVYNVTVTPQNLKRILGFLKREFRNIEGLKMYIREQLIVLDGEILLPEDIARIHQVITGFEGVFKIQFKLNPSLYNIIAEKMEKEIGLPDVHVEVINQRFIIKGNVKNKDEFNYVTYKAALYLPKYFYKPYVNDPTASGDLVPPAEDFLDQPIINYFLTINEVDPPIGRVIKIIVYFVEIAKGFENNFGFTWAPSMDTQNSKMTLTYSNQAAAAGTSPQPFIGTITGIIDNFIPKIKDAVDHKRGRVIQSAAISVEDGKSGTIQKTTSYPYLVTTGTGANTAITPTTADVGIGIGLTPTVLGNKETSLDINLGININVSQVVSMTNIGVPVTSKDSVSTFINMKSDETAAIGGVVNNTSSRSYGNNGTDDNIIINLSRSKSFQRNKSQFVVFITPTLLKTASEGSEDAKEKFRIR
ncbi:MAG: hypothetical protein WCQ53_06250 [bacterium]